MPDQQPLPALEAWQALELQLVAFPRDPQIARDQTWWRDLTGTEYNTTRKGFVRADEGVFQGHALAIVTDPLKIIWKVGTLVDVGNMPAPQGLPTAGVFREVMHWFVDLMNRWLVQSCPPINRLAFAGKLFLQTASRDEAHSLLARYLPSVRIDSNSLDLQYRVNRPRPTTGQIASLTINRMATWTIVKIEMQVQAINAASAAVAPIQDVEFNGCLLEFDVNSAAEFTGPLPPGNLSELWHELSRLSAEIAERGDIS